MNKMGYYIDYVSSGISRAISSAISREVMGQPHPRITLSKANHKNPNPLSSHKYMIPYIYNIIVYMMCTTYVLLLLSLKDWRDDSKMSYNVFYV